MFAELLEIIETQTNLIIKRFDALEKSQAEQTQILKEILSAVTLPPATSGTITARFGDQTKEGENIKMQVPMNETGTLGENIKMQVPMNATGTLTVKYTNASSGVGRTDGPPTWSAAPDGMATLTPAANGLSCVVVTLPVPADVPVNSVVITADADGDLGAGKKDIVLTALLDIFDPTQGAVLGEITVGEFVPNP